MNMRDIKKGGYTLFSNKVRKMLLAVGLSMLSMCTMSAFSYATPTIDAKFKKTDVEGKTIYQVQLKETDEKLSMKLYKQKGEDSANRVEVIPTIWQEKDGEVLAVVEIGSNEDVDTFVVENNDETPEHAEVLLAAEGFVEDNDGPEINWAYKNEEEGYIQFEAEDLTNVYRVVDKAGVERVKIDEKDQGKVVIVKCLITADDEKFELYDVLGNKGEIVLNNIKATHAIAAKNADGQKVVLNMSLPQGAILQSIETVKGKDIITESGVTKESKGQANDSLVAVYSGVPEGTTYLNVKYKLNENDEEQKTMRVLLDLDLEAPVLVKRDNLGSVVEDNGTARAYKNEAGDTAIVEVKDMISGITKIVACVETYESEETNQKFEISGLPKSVLQLIDLPEGATCIRVYDGIGNVREIDLEESVLEDNGNAINLDMELVEGDNVTATFSDRKAGLQKFVRAKKDMANTKTVQASYEKNYAPQQSAYDSITKPNDCYVVTEQTETIQKAQLQGAPEFTAVDVFGNVKEFNMNEILFDADSILMATSGKDENTVVKAIVVKLKDVRGIKKITATVDDEEVILETFETALTNQGEAPCEIDKAYEMPDNAHVSKITVYHSTDSKVTQNEIAVDFTIPASEESPITQIPEVTPGGEGGEEPGGEGEEPAEDPRKEFVTIITGPTLGEADSVPVITKIKYGIKKINYSDGCVIEFSEDLPKEVEVYTKDKAGQPLESVIITDGLGYTYNVADGSGDIAKYSPEGLEGNNQG